VNELTTDKHLIGPWVFKRIGRTWSPEGREVIGLVDGEEIIGGVVFEDCTQRAITAHMAWGDPSISPRRLIKAVFWYAFMDLGVEKVLGFVNSANTAALKTDLRLGFRPEAVIEGVFPDGDMVVMVMNRSVCPWIPRAYRNAA